MAEAAAKVLCDQHGNDYKITANTPGLFIQVTNLKTGGVLDMEVGNLLTVQGIDTADIVLLETDLAPTIYPDLCDLLRQLKKGARAFTYLDLRKIWTSGIFPYRQLDINRPISDRYSTSWSVNRGHHFFLWVKILDGDGPWDPSVLPVGEGGNLLEEEVIRRNNNNGGGGGGGHSNGYPQPYGGGSSSHHHHAGYGRDEGRRRVPARQHEGQHVSSSHRRSSGQ